MRLAIVAVLLSALVAGPVSARTVSEVGSDIGAADLKSSGPRVGQLAAPTRAETLWIFDADFQDLAGDNAGWFTIDRRGTLGCGDFWHKEAPFTDSFAYLGDSVWWCGTYDACFEQGRGYGNYWTCILARDFELSEWSSLTYEVEFEFDQRYAMENDYDYGYVDVSDDGGSSWTTVATFNNPGFSGTPGLPRNWPSDEGHQQIDLDAYAGTDIRLRFRFVSDGAYSSEDTPDNSWHSVKDGAWQLDNFVMKTKVGFQDWTVRWSDDCESPGDNGWEHYSYGGSDQETAFHRYQYDVNLFTNRYPVCNEPPQGTWVMAAVDPVSGLTVEDQDAWLISPPIDISGATNLFTRSHLYSDVTQTSGQRIAMLTGSLSGDECSAGRMWPYDVEIEGYGGPWWTTWGFILDDHVGEDWLRFAWRQWEDVTPTGPKSPGIFLHRQRVGTLVGGPDPEIAMHRYFKDWFSCESGEAQFDHVLVEPRHFEPSSMELLVWYAGQDPATADSWVCSPDPENPGLWKCQLPLAYLMDPGHEYHYYVRAMVSGGGEVLCPANAPQDYFEFSMLPLGGDVLLVDKHGWYAPGYDGQYQFKTSYYYETALDILGHSWDRWDWANYTHGHSPNGPPEAALDNYETVIWFSGERYSNSMTSTDIEALSGWIDDAWSFHTRNLVLCGNDLMQDATGNDPDNDFIGPYLGIKDYLVHEIVGEYELDVCDVAGGSEFLTSPGGCSPIAAGCPQLAEFDRLEPDELYSGTELALSFEGSGSYGAAVARSHPSSARIVTYGFGIEYMEAAGSKGGNGLPLLVDLLENALEYVGKPPDTTPTGVDNSALRNELSWAHPNPLNPSTVISYSVTDAGPVTIHVFNVAGRVVRTLLDEELTEGRRGSVVWDGLDDGGEPCASGVYFYRIEAEGFESVKKMLLLK